MSFTLIHKTHIFDALLNQVYSRNGRILNVFLKCRGSSGG